VKLNRAPELTSVPLMMTKGPFAFFRSAKVARSKTVSS